MALLSYKAFGVTCTVEYDLPASTHLFDPRVVELANSVLDLDQFSQVSDVRLVAISEGSFVWRLRVQLVAGGVATWKFTGDDLMHYTLAIDSGQWHDDTASRLPRIRRAVTALRNQLQATKVVWTRD